MSKSTAISITATNRTLSTGFNNELEFGTWATATMSIMQNGTQIATWHEKDVDWLLARLSSRLTAPLGDHLTLHLYKALLLHISPEALAILTDDDFYLDVVSRETDDSLYMEYVPLSLFRQAVDVARADHTTWLASQRPRPAAKRRTV